jgi:hypothetical protein
MKTIDGNGRMRDGYSRTRTAALLAVLAAVVAFSSASLDREMRFYDAGAYVVTAKAIATGLGYRNANLPAAEPQGLYPPALPALLAVAWRIWPAFPDNLVWMRTGTIVLGLLFLVITRAYLIQTEALSAWEATGVIALVALHPLFLEFTAEVSSEIPYALASIVALYGYVRFNELGRARWLCVLVVGLMFGVLTRTLGVALVGGLVIDALGRRRKRLALAVASAGSAAIIPWSIWSWRARTAYEAYPPEIAANYRGYVANLATTNWLGDLHRALLLNITQFVSAWSSFVLPWVPVVVATSAVIFVTHPIPARMLRRRKAHDVYCLAASAMIVAWPWPLNGRFVLVLSPFLIAYCLEGVNEILRRLDARKKRRALAPIVLVVVAGAAIVFDATRSVDAVRVRRGTSHASQQFHEAIEWIKANTDPDAVLVTASDPLYYLLTDRKTVRLAYPDPFTIYYDRASPARFSKPEATLDWFRRIGGCYFIRDSLLGRAESSFYAGLIDSLQRVSSGSMVRLHASRDGSVELFRLERCAK